MEVKARSTSIRMSARKLRLVANLVRGMGIKQAQAVLKHLPQRAAQPVLLTLDQAVANAVNNFGLSDTSLELAEIQVTEGQTYKRWRAASRGRANAIMKRTAHLRIIVRGRKQENRPAVIDKKADKKKNSKKDVKKEKQSGTKN